ncbi:nucleotidyltransferase family protein [Sulfurovum sp. TSL1]|uniref:nucleotidyltransferase domain-containing protein n=1 Tax=Sulfurovum sp. TSL1 TaxID=2826994 RepID=UPI001CC41BAB|nr:nucleotidyltransferase family protein [Sulfurovum sp. TSL1]GIT98125.1 hypothetical protein TSL1_09460 [Sulfurovum sp. TSL1]
MTINKDLNLSDELSFLIACCQTEPSNEDIEFILSYLSLVPDGHGGTAPTEKILKPNNSYLNAERLTLHALISLANQHGVLPLVYKTIKNIVEKDSSLVPGDHEGTAHIECSKRTQGYRPYEEILPELKAYYMRIAQRNMLMTSELIKIMDLLRENHIEALAFKGPALAQMAYGNITLRQFGDIDVLVNETDILKAGQIITSNGYNPDVHLDFLNNQALLDVSSDLGFRNKRNNTYIELHWKLFRKKLSVTLDGLNIRSNPSVVNIQDKEIQTLQSDLLLVYLCAHGSKHMWERIEWIVDVDRLIRNLDSIDWKAVLYYAKEMHSINTLFLGLSLCNELFDTDFPDTIQKEIDKHENIKCLKNDTLQLLNNTFLKQDSGTSAMFKKFDYHAKLYDSFLDRLKYYLSTVFKITPDDVLNINLPKYLSFLYFIIRPLRLARKYMTK